MTTTQTVPKRITSADVIACLRNRFPAQQYAFLEQVAPFTGARNYRWADAVAMSVWPSRGFDIHGIEVKVSRYDWVKELAQPEKSAPIQQYCNRWWIATPDESIVQPGELPPTWGHMVMKKDGMRVVVEAPALSPIAVSIEFVASVLRNVQGADAAEVERKIRDAVSKATESSRDYTKQQYADLKKSVDEFELASGIKLGAYSDGKELGEAVETLRRLKWRVEGIQNAIVACEDIRGMLQKVSDLASLHAPDPPKP